MDKDRYLSEISNAIFGVQKKIYSEIYSEYQLPISIPHLHLLAFIKHQPHCTVSDIASHLGITLGGVTQLVEKMVKLELVNRVRGINDRRVVHIDMTEKGFEIFNQLDEYRHRVFKKYFSILSDEEIKTYHQIFTKLMAGILNEK